MTTTPFTALPLLLFVLALLTGCEANRKRVITPSPARETATTFPSAVGIYLRLATAADLRPILVTHADPADHFPICTLKLYNAASEPIIVGYTPNCVTVHCGSFELHGPGVTFVHRQEILEPQQALELEIPPGGWTMTDAGGERQLMIPTTLPAGSYEIWATFKLEGPSPSDLASKHDSFNVR